MQAEKCKIINAELQDLSRNTNSRALFISAFNYSCTSTSTVLPFFFGLTTCSELQKIDVRNGEIHSEAKQRTVRVRVKSNNRQFPISLTTYDSPYDLRFNLNLRRIATRIL